MASWIFDWALNQVWNLNLVWICFRVRNLKIEKEIRIWKRKGKWYLYAWAELPVCGPTLCVRGPPQLTALSRTPASPPKYYTRTHSRAGSSGTWAPRHQLLLLPRNDPRVARNRAKSTTPRPLRTSFPPKPKSMPCGVLWSDSVGAPELIWVTARWGLLARCFFSPWRARGGVGFQ